MLKILYMIKNFYLIIVLVLVIIITCVCYNKHINYEHYNDEVGAYCRTCYDKNTINKCTACFDCVWISKLRRCVPGDNVVGPYDNRLHNYKWITGTPSYIL